MIIWFDKNCIERITTPTNCREAIAALNDVINTLIGAAAKAAINGNIAEYSFDDGQTKTKVEYKDVKAITASIQALQALQEVFLQSPGMNNRVIRLIDSGNFVNYNYPI